MPSFFIACVFLVAGTALAHAEIYTWTDAQGRKHFTDNAAVTPKDAKAIEGGRISQVGNPTFNLRNRSRQVPYAQSAGNMLVDGRINGMPLRMIVDTGASFVVIPPGIAKQAGIKTTGARMVNLRTASGEVRAPMVRLSRIEVGGIEQTNVDAVVHTLPQNETMGLLGMSFLSAFRMTVDHDRGFLLLEQR